eukprot:scaffold22298_cov84-Skeletonema_dohrnii-CCMP3373.AAC.2
MILHTDAASGEKVKLKKTYMFKNPKFVGKEKQGLQAKERVQIIGFSVIAFDEGADLAAEISALSAIKGVASVEEDAKAIFGIPDAEERQLRGGSDAIQDYSSHERHLEEEEEESTPYTPPPAATPATDSPYLEPSSSSEPEPSSEISVEPSSKPFCEAEAETTDVNFFYPNWDWEVSSCVNDGDEPDYMAVNPTGWLFSTKSACCEKWFGGAPYDECMGDDDCNEDEYEALFYPDWEDTMGCINNGKEPYYMQTNPTSWMENTREECCKRYFEWEYFDCIGTEPPASDEYYPDWSNWDSPTCVNDGEIPQYMFSIPSSLHPTLEECCKEHFGWDFKACMGSSFVAPDVKWYVNWSITLGVGKCVQDCNGEWPCGGVAAQWNQLYDDQKTCCERRVPWAGQECYSPY